MTDRSPRCTPTRLATAWAGSRSWWGSRITNTGIRSIRSQVASAVDLFVQTSRFTDGTRRITHNHGGGREQYIITLHDIFLFEKTGITESGRIQGRFRATGIRPKFCDRLK